MRLMGKRETRGRAVAMLALFALLLAGANGAFAGSTSSTGGYLGVITSDMDAAMLEALNFEEDGILINEVMRDTPAEKAGLKSGDIIMQVDDRKMISTKSLKRAMWRLDPGDQATLIYWRNGKKETVKVTVAEKPEKNIQAFGNRFFMSDDKAEWQGKMKKRAFLGVELETLNNQLAEYFGVKRGEGALVKEVVEESAAEKAGIKAGDILLTVAGEEISGSGDVTDAIRSHKPGEEVELVVMRNKKKQTIKATLGERENEIFFNTGSVGYMVRDIAESIPDIHVELEELRDDLHGLKVRVDEMAD